MEAHVRFTWLARVEPGRWLAHETWYELIHAHQGAGRKVIADIAALAAREAFVADLLRDLPLAQMGPVRARAYLTLGMAAYELGAFAQARAYWRRARREDPSILLDGRFVSCWLKSWLGPRVLSRARELRRA